jgi:hypothetical protein
MPGLWFVSRQEKRLRLRCVYLLCTQQVRKPWTGVWLGFVHTRVSVLAPVPGRKGGYRGVVRLPGPLYLAV